MARFNNGWVKLWRGAVDGDLFDKPLLWKLWCWILTSATWYPQNKVIDGVKTDLPPGTVIMGYDEVAGALRCSKSTVHRWIKYLTTTERISTESRTHGTIVTVLNWSAYQSGEEEGGTEIEQEWNESRTKVERKSNPNEEERRKKKEEERDISPKNLSECLLTWEQTLLRLKIQKPARLDREGIARLIQRYGVEKTKLALLGAGFEEKSDKYDPTKHVGIRRLLDKPGIFDTFVNLGAQNQTTQEQVTEWKVKL